MTDKVVVLVTAASKKECRKIARHLVESKLAACVNITQPIESVYRWEGKITTTRNTSFSSRARARCFRKSRPAISKCTAITPRRSSACRSSRARAIICNGWAIR